MYLAGNYWNNISTCQSISSWEDLNIMRLRKSECKAEPQHKSCAICQSHQQPCRWDLTAKLPAQGLSALSPAAGNAFSSKILSHETKNYLTTEVNFGFSILLFFFNWWWACNKEVKKTAAKWLKNRCISELDQKLFLSEDCTRLICSTSRTASLKKFLI